MRLFVALDIPEGVRLALGKLSKRFEKICPGARWVGLAGAHVTLKFIGEVPPEQLGPIRSALRGIPPAGRIALHFAGVGFFPDDRRPRVFWARVQGDAALAKLAAVVEAGFAPLGVPRETRSFNPHITLARFKSLEGLERLRADAAKLDAAEFGHASVNQFHLYRSVLKPAGAEYTRLDTFPFPGEQAP